MFQYSYWEKAIGFLKLPFSSAFVFLFSFCFSSFEITLLVATNWETIYLVCWIFFSWCIISISTNNFYFNSYLSDKLGLMKIKNCPSNVLLRPFKISRCKWKKTYATHVSEKNAYSRLCKECINYKESVRNSIAKWARHLDRYFKKWYLNVHKMYEKGLNLIGNQKNLNHNK